MGKWREYKYEKQNEGQKKQKNRKTVNKIGKNKENMNTIKPNCKKTKMGNQLTKLGKSRNYEYEKWQRKQRKMVRKRKKKQNNIYESIQKKG